MTVFILLCTGEGGHSHNIWQYTHISRMTIWTHSHSHGCSHEPFKHIQLPDSGEDDDDNDDGTSRPGHKRWLLLLSCDALWLEIYNSLTSASHIDFPSRKVSCWACDCLRECVCVCACEWNNTIFTAIAVIWSPVERDFPCIRLLSTLCYFQVFLRLAKVFHSSLWVAWHDLIWTIWLLCGCSLASALKNYTYASADINAHFANKTSCTKVHIPIFCPEGEGSDGQT